MFNSKIGLTRTIAEILVNTSLIITLSNHGINHVKSFLKDKCKGILVPPSEMCRFAQFYIVVK